MKVSSCSIPEVLLFKPTIFSDERGFFFESFNQRFFQECSGLEVTFVQDNDSSSAHGVLRGLHYQLPPKVQGKLVRVVVGEIFDVALDIRRSSATFGKWVGERLSSDNQYQLWIPPGFAHGFIALSKHAEVLYKTTDYWASHYERCIQWSDPASAILWPLAVGQPLLSKKDQKGMSLEMAEVFA